MSATQPQYVNTQKKQRALLWIIGKKKKIRKAEAQSTGIVRERKEKVSLDAVGSISKSQTHTPGGACRLFKEDGEAIKRPHMFVVSGAEI